MFGDFVFGIHTATTFLLTGMVWFAQIVHYPLLRYVPARAVAAFEQEHYRRAFRGASVLMAVETASGVLLLSVRPETVPVEVIVISLALLGFGAVMTWGYCVPCHKALRQNPSTQLAKKLMQVNAWRTAAYTARSVLLLFALVL